MKPSAHHFGLQSLFCCALLSLALSASLPLQATPQGTFRGQSALEFLYDLQAGGGAAGHVVENSAVYGLQWVIDGSGNITPSVLSKDYVFVDTNADGVADAFALRSSRHVAGRNVGSNFGGYQLTYGPAPFVAPAYTGPMQEAGAGLYEVNVANPSPLIADSSLRVVVSSTPAQDLLLGNLLTNDFISGGKNWMSHLLSVLTKVDTLYPTTAANLSGKTFQGTIRTRDYLEIEGFDKKYAEGVLAGNITLQFTSTSACQFAAQNWILIVQRTMPDVDGDPTTIEGDQDYGNRMVLQDVDAPAFACTYSVDINGKVDVRANPDGEGVIQLAEFYADVNQRYLVATDSGNTRDSAGDLIGGGEGTESAMNGLGVLFQRASFSADQDVRNDAAAGTFLFHLIASDYESGLFSNWSPEYDQFGRGIVETMSAAAPGHAGYNQCSLALSSLETEKRDFGSEAGGDVNSSVDKYSSPLEASLDCRYQVGQDGSLELVLTFDDDGEVAEFPVYGFISNNYQAVTFALPEEGDVQVEDTPLVDDAGAVVIVGVKYSGDLSADQDADGYRNEDEFQIYRGQDTDNDGDPNSSDPDDDNDGIEDSIELANPSFLHPWNAADGRKDQDGDGVSNAAEAIAATGMDDAEDKPGEGYWVQGFWTHMLFSGSYHQEEVCRESSRGYLETGSGDWVADPTWDSFCSTRAMFWGGTNLELFLFSDDEVNNNCEFGNYCPEPITRNGNYLSVGDKGMATPADGLALFSYYDYSGNPLRDENWDPGFGEIEYGLGMLVKVAVGLTNADLIDNTYAVAVMRKSFFEGANAEFSETNTLASFDLTFTGNGTCSVSSLVEHKLEQFENGDNDFDDRSGLFHTETPITISACSFATDASNGEMSLTLTPSGGDPLSWSLKVTPDFSYLASSQLDDSWSSIGYLLGVKKAGLGLGGNSSVSGVYFIAGMTLSFWNYTDNALVGYDGDGLFRAIIEFSGGPADGEGFSDCTMRASQSTSGRGLSGDVGLDAVGWAWIEGQADYVEACRYRVNGGSEVEVEETEAGESPESIFFQLGDDGNALLFSEGAADFSEEGSEAGWTALGLGIKFTGSNYQQLVADFLEMPVTEGEVTTENYLALHKLWDMNADGVEELGQFGLRNSNDKPQLMVIDPVSGATLTTYTWAANWYNPQLVRIADRNGDGVDELGLFGVSKTNQRPQLTIKDGAQASSTLNTFSWPANWYNVEFVELDDTTNDGITELAIFGFANSNDQPKLVVRDGSDPAVSLPTTSWSARWKNVRFVQTPDVNNDGIDEVAIFGQLISSNRNQLFVKDGLDPSIIHGVYNWGDNWNSPQFVRLDDLNNDQVGDVALMGVNKADDRAQVIVKSGSNRAVRVRGYGWPSVLTDPVYLRVPDRDGDGLAELGMAGVRSNNGRAQIVVKASGSTQTLDSVVWSHVWKDGQVHILDDLSVDGLEDYALLANHVSTGAAELAVIDSATGEPLRVFSWPSMDATSATLVQLSDMDGDNIPEVGLYSVASGSGVLEIKSGADPEQLLSRITWQAAWY